MAETYPASEIQPEVLWSGYESEPVTDQDPFFVRTLIFADDIVILARSEAELRGLIARLETFCSETGLEVNMSKTRWMRFGEMPGDPFVFQGAPIDETLVYKYLGVEITRDLRWTSCFKARTASGLKTLYSMLNKCEAANLLAWSLRRNLFDALVKPVLLYNVQTWGPTLSRTNWRKVEGIHKKYLQEELGVREQTPYVLMLAETGRIPLEIEGLLLTLQYVQRLQVQDSFASRARVLTYAKGWQADVHRWASYWNIPEQIWGNADLRDKVIEQVVAKLWRDRSSRQSYYICDITPLLPYGEKPFLRSNIPRRLRQTIARFRTSSGIWNLEFLMP
ncbi:hypothetical protein R1sor_008963 [Riccia sorocarpa]|uniref:Reverse transcriptase domain-containing protein n=1 Tax=Riccia sorocarpa TaxID=122646 RepID=A0ABD3HAG2_9MARC